MRPSTLRSSYQARAAVAAAVVGSACLPGLASVTPTGRLELVQIQAFIDLYDDQNQFLDRAFVVDESNVQDTLLPNLYSQSLNSSGTLFDVPTNAIPVATASMGVSHTASFVLTPLSLVYQVSGRLDATGELINPVAYNPGLAPDRTDFLSLSLYNSIFRFRVSDLPADFDMEVTLSNGVGTVFNDGFLFEDLNGNGFLDFGDEPILADMTLVSQNGISTLSGTLPPSPNQYVVIFFGNTFNNVSGAGDTFNSGANYTAQLTVTVIPEPSAALPALVMASLALRRRR